MSCVPSQQLDLYVDGELPQHELAQIQDHLHSCSSCAVEALGRIQMKRATHTAAMNTFVPSPEFRLQLQNSIVPARRSIAGWWPVLSFATAAAAALVISVIMLSYRSARQDVLAEAVDAHVSTLASANPIDVVSTDRHTVKPWFQGKVPFTFNLPELQNSEFRLIGGRVSYIGQRPAAHLLFGIRRHQISVFILQDSENFTKLIRGSRSDRRLNFNVDTWSENGLRYVVLNDAATNDVQGLSHLLQASSQ